MRRCARLQAALVAAALSVWSLAGQQPPSTSPSPTASASAAGHIVNALTGDFISGAVIRLRPLSMARDFDKTPQTESGADGAFQFNSLPPGSYLIRAEKEGFVTTPLNRQTPFLTVVAGDTKTNLALQLTPQGVVSGTVSDEDGKPVSPARVTAFQPVAERGRIFLRRGSTAEVRVDGSFTITKLAPGRYFLVADPEGSDRRTRAQDGTEKTPDNGRFVRTVFPRSLDFDGATSVEVTAGQTLAELTISMRKMETHQIRGKVAELPPGVQASRLRVYMSRDGSVDGTALAQSATVDSNGTWLLDGVVPGSYTLELAGSVTGESIQAGGRSHAPLSQQHVEVGGGDLSDVVLNVNPPLQLAGTISIDGSSTPASLNGIRVVARPLLDVAHSTQAFGNVGADGTFLLRNLDREPYVINVLAASTGFYVKSLELNGQDVLNKEADLSQIFGGGQLRITVHAGAGEIDGTVQDSGSAASGVAARTAIVLVPEMISPDGSNVTFAYAGGTAGQFKFGGVAPGNYRLYAVDTADPNVWQNPDFLAQMQNSGTVVNVTENGHTPVQLSKLSNDQVAEAAQRTGIETP